jgi:hypothetical protein
MPSKITFSNLGLHGKLGNQMFQYALLVGVAARRNLDVVIPEEQMLGFDLTAEMRPRHELKNQGPIFQEQGAAFHFDERVFHCEADTDFNGYFQSHHYFTHAEAKLRREFSFVPEVEAYARQWLKKIETYAKGRPRIAVHARRGDYLNYPGRFIPFTDSYFQRAREAIGIKNPAFIFFSNEPSWLIETYPGNDFLLLDEPDEFVCLCVASECEHFICSASSFSWWAAWLSTFPEKRIVIPSPWFGPDYEYPESENQRSPDTWIRVDPRE